MRTLTIGVEFDNTHHSAPYKPWNLGGIISLFLKHGYGNPETLLYTGSIGPNENEYIFVDETEELWIGCPDLHVSLDRSDRDYHIWDMNSM